MKKMLLLGLLIASSLFAQAQILCETRCDRKLNSAQNVAEADYLLTAQTCGGANIANCATCLFLTNPVAILGCYVSCGIVLPLICNEIITTAWNRYLELIEQAGNEWAICLDNCDTIACI